MNKIGVRSWCFKFRKFVKTKCSSYYKKKFDEFSRGLTKVTLIIIDPVESVVCTKLEFVVGVSSLEKFVKTKCSSYYMKQFDEFSRGLTSVTLIIIDPVESVQNWSSSLVPVPELCRPLFFSVCDAANERRS